jgi:hypothetical protein
VWTWESAVYPLLAGRGVREEEMKWFCALVGSYVMLLDYAALKAAWEAYKAGRPFEAVRILGAADKGALVLSPREVRELARKYPSEVWLTSFDEHELEVLLGEVHPLWLHVLLSGHEAGEGVEEKMYLVPESDAPGFNAQRTRLLVTSSPL